MFYAAHIIVKIIHLLYVSAFNNSVFDVYCNSLGISSGISAGQERTYNSEPEIEMPDEFYDTAERVLDFAAPGVLEQTAPEAIETVRKRSPKLSKSDMQFLGSTLLTIISIIISIWLSVSSGAQADAQHAEEMALLQTISDSLARIADLEEQRVELFQQGDERSQILADSTQAIYDRLETVEHPDDVDSVQDSDAQLTEGQ